jgi:hypothetical protein
MASQAGASERSVALEWLRQHPNVAETARKRVDVPGKAFPDAVLEDPARLVEVFKGAIVEAVRNDAPVGVAEELLGYLRFFSLRVERFDRSGFVGTQLAALQGLRDRTEIIAALQASANNAPDEASRAPLERLIALANAVPASDRILLAPNGGLDSGPGTSAVGTGVNTGGTDTGGTDTGGTDTGGTDTGGTDTGVTDTGSVIDTGGTDTGGTDTGGTSFDFGAQVGGQVGGEVATALGIPDGPQVGAQLGSQFGSQYGLTPGASGGLFQEFCKLVGGAVGFVLGGPGGAVAGGAVGERFGSFIDHAIGDEPCDAACLMACLLCGPTCLPCVLAADSGVHH